MTVSGLSTATLQTLLSQLNSGSSNGSSSQTTSLLSALKASKQTTSTNANTSAGSSPAYVLSTSQKQTQSQLFSYSNMGTLINKAESGLANLLNQNEAGVATDGLGRPLSSAVTVDVTHLATAQTLTTGSFPSSDTTVLGTGTLNVSVGSGSVVPVTINDGSLSGVAKSINDAAAGIAASVVKNNDGSYSLQITGAKTGAENAFSLSGISDLVYSPSTGQGSLQATTTASDAAYSVGGVSKTSPTNDNVTVAPGVTTTFTQTGTQTLSSPVGQSNALNSAQTLVSEFNSLVSADPTGGTTSTSSKSTTITQMLDKVAQQSFGGKSLSDLGISLGTDGSLSINQSTLTAAYNADPKAFNTTITQAAESIKTALSSSNGVASQVHSSVHSLLTQLVQIPSLAQVLAGNTTSSSGSSSSGVASQILSGYSA